ncbi:hypothetical protein D9M73_105410 [compost metagenome]
MRTAREHRCADGRQTTVIGLCHIAGFKQQAGFVDGAGGVVGVADVVVVAAVAVVHRHAAGGDRLVTAASILVSEGEAAAGDGIVAEQLRTARDRRCSDGRQTTVIGLDHVGCRQRQVGPGNVQPTADDVVALLAGVITREVAARVACGHVAARHAGNGRGGASLHAAVIGHAGIGQRQLPGHEGAQQRAGVAFVDSPGGAVAAHVAGAPAGTGKGAGLPHLRSGFARAAGAGGLARGLGIPETAVHGAAVV